MGNIEINLAGFNIDRDGLTNAIKILKQGQEQIKFYNSKAKKDSLQDLKKLLNKLNNGTEKTINLLENLTPETIAASYARISRSSKTISQLREDARKDVIAARNSYSTINYLMGHNSIAEHVQLNFDILNVSRKAIETIESKRLQGYTEKSQRYVTFDGDFTIPKEIKGTSLEQKFIDLIQKQNDFYSKNLEPLLAWHQNQDYTQNFKSLNCLENKKKQQKTIKGYAKEDARYSLALATQSQLGMTTSGRNIEKLISKLKSSNLIELKEIGQKLLQQVHGIAPSVIKYTEATDYFEKTRPELKNYVQKFIMQKNPHHHFLNKYVKGDVGLFTKLNRDDSIIAGLLFSSSKINYQTALNITLEMTNKEKIDLLKQADKYQKVHDPKLREYELGDRVAEFKISATGYGQMKRHRMDTIITQPYNINLGITVPESIKNTKTIKDFNQITKETTDFYKDMVRENIPTEVAEYILTNAHKRRILFDANNRQIHAFAAERLNHAAQWDIRNLAQDFTKLVKQESPITLHHVCGKDQFYETKK